MEAANVTELCCPQCGATLPAADPRCDRCGWADVPLSTTGSHTQLKQLLDRPWVIVVLLLHVGLLGIPVYWKTSYSLSVRLLIVIASIVYTVTAVALIVIMLRWLFHVVAGG